MRPRHKPTLLPDEITLAREMIHLCGPVVAIITEYRFERGTVRLLKARAARVV